MWMNGRIEIREKFDQPTTLRTMFIRRPWLREDVHGIRVELDGIM